MSHLTLARGGAKKTTLWIDQFGESALCQSLKIKLPRGAEPRYVRLTAIGRSNARFRSYGYDTPTDVLVLPWSQFVRLRYAIGPGHDFFELLMQAVISETAAAIERKPLPYVLERHGLRITFKDIWSDLESDGFAVQADEAS